MTWFARERPVSKIAAQLTSHLATRAILLAATVIVARASGVGAYGLFALALVFYQAGLLLRDAGLGQALVIVGTGRGRMMWRAFLAASAIGMALAALIAVASDVATGLLGLPDAAPILRVLALAFGIGSLAIASNAALERDLRFGARAAVEVSSYVALGVVTTVGLAAGWGAMALAWGYVAQATLQAALALALEPPWLGRTEGTAGLRTLVYYGGLLWASALLTYLATNVDNLAAAALGGATTIGVYALSYTVGTMIAISLAQVLNRVALPYYARADAAGRRQTFASVVPLSAALAIAAAAPVIALAPEIRDVLLGPGAPATPLVLLAAYGVARAVGVALGTALNGSGSARVVTWSSALNIAVIAALVVPGYQLAGAAGIAAAVLVAMVGSVVVLGRAAGRHQGRLDFLPRAGLGVAALAALVIGPWEPLPVAIRIAAATALAVVAAAWAWRLVRADGLAVLPSPEPS